jgi:argininosuccinate lyase
LNDSGKVDWERFGRTRKARASEIEELDTWRRNPVSFEVASYASQMLIHHAHTVMLAEEGIIKRDEAARIIEGLKQVEEEAASDLRLAGYMSTETALIEKIGEVGGKMHTGRSRNDLGHTQRRMYYRDRLNLLIGSLIHFRRALLKKAEENLETVMPGYTHLRQAQPVTLAHYLVAHVDATGRSVERLEDIYRRTNLNPLGAAALAGTSWPLNRNRTTELLGFDALLENSQDGVAAIDYFMEFASAIAIHMSNLSRLAEDLQIWSSDEYGLIDLDEAYAGTSSIMPQKKNPSILESVKSYAAESMGTLVSVISSMKGTSYSNIIDRVMLDPVCIDTAIGSANVMAGVVSTLTSLKDVMLARLKGGFSTMTDLADALVREYDISFRQAHDIVAQVTVIALSEGKKAHEITSEMVAEVSERTLGRELVISEEELESAVDPVQNVMRRNIVGGPSPSSVKTMIDSRWIQVEAEETRHNKRISKLRKAYEILVEAEEVLTSRRSP